MRTTTYSKHFLARFDLRGWRDLRDSATRQGTTIAEYIRRAVREAVAIDRENARKARAWKGA